MFGFYLYCNPSPTTEYSVCVENSCFTRILNWDSDQTRLAQSIHCWTRRAAAKPGRTTNKSVSPAGSHEGQIFKQWQRLRNLLIEFQSGYGWTIYKTMWLRNTKSPGGFRTHFMLSAFRLVFSPKFHQFPEYLNRLFVQCLLTNLQLYTAYTRIWLVCPIFNSDFTYSRSSHHNQINSKYMSFLMIMTQSEKFCYSCKQTSQISKFQISQTSTDLINIRRKT